MSNNEKLTELLSQDPPNIRKLFFYSRFRFKKKMDNYVNLGKLAMTYHELKKKHDPPPTPLHVACWVLNSPEVIRILVDEGWGINDEVGGFDIPLGIALDCGHLSVSKALIELGADVNILNSDGFTPMYYALSIEKKEKTIIAAVNQLLNAGVSINAIASIETNEAPIHIAIVNQLHSVVSFLLQKGASLNVQDYEGFKPIHTAVFSGDLDMVKLLLLHGVDFYVETVCKESPLMLAIKHDFVEIVKELAKAGCDVNKTCSNGTIAPIFVAICCQKLEMVKVLVSLGADLNKALPGGLAPLHTVGMRNPVKFVMLEKENLEERKSIAEYLVENGAILNVLNKEMDTPLQVAIESRFLSLAKLFIRLGADFNIRDQYNNTIFHQVVPLNRDLINLLLEFGGDYQVCNADGYTPYHLAISHEVELKFIKSFAKHGCPYNQNLPVWTRLVKKNKAGKQFFTSEIKFFKGIKENNLELVKRAVMDGAVPNSCCEELQYPLHFLSLQGFNDILTFLLEKNVQPNILNKEGKTPLHLAASKGHYDTCRILLRYGACYNYRSKKSPKTPRMIASELKHNAVVELFDNVDDMFCKARSKKKEIINFLKSKLENQSEYLQFANAIDIKGNSLISTALQHKLYANAEEMLKIKFSNTTLIS